MQRKRHYGLLLISVHVLVFRSRLHKSLKGEDNEMNDINIDINMNMDVNYIELIYAVV